MDRRLLRAGVVLPALALCGCTAIGYGIGKAIEKDAAKTRPIRQKDLITLGHGEPLELQFWDGTKTLGVFQGLQWMPAATYAAAYDVARASAGPRPPAPRARGDARQDQPQVRAPGSTSGSGRGSSPSLPRRGAARGH